MNTEKQGTDVATQVLEIKRELRAMMNGPVSQSMRQHGLTYRLNFGVEVPRLVQLAETLGHSRPLAIALWQEDIRECRMLATMLMPPADFDADLGSLWAESLRFPEEADALAQNLLRHTAWASSELLPWMASERHMMRYLAYQLLACLLRDGRRLTTRDGTEFLDHAVSDLQAATPEGRTAAQAARRALIRYMECGIPEERMAQSCLRKLKNSTN